VLDQLGHVFLVVFGADLVVGHGLENQRKDSVAPPDKTSQNHRSDDEMVRV
jgi:hypothetical protein